MLSCNNLILNIQYICSMVRVAQKLDRAASCLEYFTTHEWRFLSTNVQALWSQMPPADRKVSFKILYIVCHLTNTHIISYSVYADYMLFAYIPDL